MSRHFPIMVCEQMTEPHWAYVLEHDHHFLWWRWLSYTWKVHFYRPESITAYRTVRGWCRTLESARAAVSVALSDTATDRALEEL